MLDFMKIFPSRFLVTSERANSGASEVPPEVSVGHFSLESQWTTWDRA